MCVLWLCVVSACGRCMALERSARAVITQYCFSQPGQSAFVRACIGRVRAEEKINAEKSLRFVHADMQQMGDRACVRACVISAGKRHFSAK